jgi:predicted DNA binding CopG/RHH family protein
MKKTKKIKYTDEPIGEIKIVSDFLPKPRDLILKDDTEKVTLRLTRSSIEFFKKEAEKHHVPYQKMIRTLVDKYSSHYI